MDIMSSNDMQARIQLAQNLRDSIRVRMDLTVFQKMQYYIAECGPEISGLGAVRTGGQHEFSVDEVFILRQPVTPVSADLTESIALLVERLVKDGREDYIPQLKFWWHSHADGGAGFSMIDTSTIQRLGSTNMMDYLISFVGNHHGHYAARLDLFRPFRLQLLGIPIFVTLPRDQQLIEQCAGEIKENVKLSRWREIAPSWLGGMKAVKPAGQDFAVAMDASLADAPELTEIELDDEGGDANEP